MRSTTLQSRRVNRWDIFKQGVAAFVVILAMAQCVSGANKPHDVIAPIKVGPVSVTHVLQRLGAQLEQGSTVKERDAYSSHFDRMDTNKDGKHTRVEYVDRGTYMTPQARAGIFRAADGNADGVVTKAEYVLNRIITDEAKGIVQGMDDDRDGLVERVEFVAHAAKLLSDLELAEQVYEALDANADGGIPIPEYLRIWGQWARSGQEPAEARLVSPIIVPDALGFNCTGDEVYSFNTGVLQGTLRSGGKSKGLSLLTHVPSGIKLNEGGAGIFSHYRVFTTNQRYGHAAWDWPSQSTRLEDGAVQVHWPAGEDHPFELTVIYRWSASNTLDVETRVKAHQALPQFESFLASYFSKDFPASSVYAKKDSKTGMPPGFATTEKTFGDWQMFPRDSKAVDLIQDGRWQKEPNPVAWAIRPDMALPIGTRRHVPTGLIAIVMAPAEDCFAMSTPYVGEGHFSLYQSLFGRSVAAGETATAHSRLVVAESPTEAQILALYKSYMKDLSGLKNKATKTACSTWPFFALCMDTHDAKQRTLAQQATLLRELGYAGCAHLWLDELETRVKTVTQAGLRLFQVYVRVDLSKSQAFDEARVRQILPILAPHQTQLALLMTGGKPSDRALDDRAVKSIQRLADLARPHGVTIVLYPHSNDWLETCSDAVRIAKKVNRPGDVGVMFNLGLCGAPHNE